MSLIPKFLTSAGREEVARAADVARTLENQLEAERHSLSGKQVRRIENRLADARRTTRRDFLAKLGVGLGTAGAGAAVISFLTGKEEEVEPTPAVTKEKPAQPEIVNQTEAPDITSDLKEVSEEELQFIIERIELGFLEGEKIIRSKIEQNGLPPYLNMHDLMSPFRAVQINTPNELRNNRVFLRQPEDKIKITNDSYFQYETLDRVKKTRIEEENILASFAPGSRTMYVRPEMDTTNMIDLLLLYHEVWHAIQDEQVRFSIETDEEAAAYIEKHSVQAGKITRIDLSVELEAWAYQIELTDVLLDQRLRNGSITIEEVMRTLRLQNMPQMLTMESVYELALSYFPKGMGGGRDAYPKEYIQKMMDSYTNPGYEFYIPPTIKAL